MASGAGPGRAAGGAAGGGGKREKEEEKDDEEEEEEEGSARGGPAARRPTGPPGHSSCTAPRPARRPRPRGEAARVPPPGN